MLQRVVLKLKDCGVNDLVVNVHHFADKVVEFLDANNNFGLDIHVSDERSLLLDTGGGILAARRWLDGDEPVIVHNADILTDFPLGEMIESHRRNADDVTLLVASRQSSRYLLFDDKSTMHGWCNERTGEVLPAGVDADHFGKRAFGGVHVISPRIFDKLDDYARSINKEVFSIVPFYVAACHSLNISGFKPAEAYRWFDIGKPETLAAARQIFEK